MLLELIIVKLYLFELITVHIFANVLSVFNFPYTKTICYFHLQIHFSHTDNKQNSINGRIQIVTLFVSTNRFKNNRFTSNREIYKVYIPLLYIRYTSLAYIVCKSCILHLFIIIINQKISSSFLKNLFSQS